MDELKVIAQCGGMLDGMEFVRMRGLELSGYWDAMGVEERRRWMHNGEVLDTEAGRGFVAWLDEHVGREVP